MEAVPRSSTPLPLEAPGPNLRHDATVARTLLDLLYDEAPRADFDRLVEEAGDDPEARRSYDVALRLRELIARQRSREAELSALYDTASDLTAIRDVNAILSAIVRRARQLLKADMTYLSLNDEGEGASYMKVTDGALSAEFRTLRLPLGTGLLGLVAQTGAPYFTSDYQHDERFVHRRFVDDAVADEGIRAILGVPLVVEGRGIGALLAPIQALAETFDTKAGDGTSLPRVGDVIQTLYAGVHRAATVTQAQIDELAIAAQAATNQGVIQIYSVDTMAGAVATSKIAQSDTPDNMLSLLTARALTVLGMSLLVITPVAFAMMGGGLSNDLASSGILIALMYTGLLFTVLVFLSVTFSAVVTNTPGSLAMIYILWYTAITMLLAIQADGFSPSGVLGRIPALLQGEFEWSLHFPFLVALFFPLVVLPPLGIRMFGQRDF